MPKKTRVERTRNAGTMTEAAFWGMIRSALRRRSMYWKPIINAKNAARRAVVGGRQKWEYQCSVCKGWFKGTEVEVDHINPAGSLTCSDDLKGFVTNLFAEEGYDVKCKPCHRNHTNVVLKSKKNEKPISDTRKGS